MKIHFRNYNGDRTTLPHREHMVGAKPFTKRSSQRELQKYILTRGTLIGGLLYAMALSYTTNLETGGELGFVCAFLSLFLRPILHAICYKNDVYLLVNTNKLSCLVYGLEDMSKERFVIMNLLPDIIFGVIPFILFLIFPQYISLGTFGIANLALGVGDFHNSMSVIKEMPKGARMYFYQSLSYWFMPNTKEDS